VVGPVADGLIQTAGSGGQRGTRKCCRGGKLCGLNESTTVHGEIVSEERGRCEGQGAPL
jgi:hypothetical protein